MRTPASTAFLLFLPFWAAHAGGEARVKLKVEGMKDDEGAVRVEVIGASEEWLNQTVHQARLTIRAHQAEDFFALPGGEYGIRVFHDRNDNGELDRNSLGVPIEPMGYSNNFMPKFGPPRLSLYQVPLNEGDYEITIPVQVTPLALRRFAVGAGLITSFSEYAGGNTVYRILPLINYTDEYLYILGPAAGLILINNRNVRLELKARARFAGFDEGDNELLEGLHDRRITAEGGPGVRFQLFSGWYLSADAMIDLLYAHNGQNASMMLSRRFRAGPLMVVPGIGPEWQSAEVNQYYYGIRASEARPDRPEYTPGGGTNIKASLNVNMSLNEDWIVIGIASINHLSAAARHSPIVTDSVSRSLIVGAMYRF